MLQSSTVSSNTRKQWNNHKKSKEDKNRSKKKTDKNYTHPIKLNEDLDGNLGIKSSRRNHIV